MPEQKAKETPKQEKNTQIKKFTSFDFQKIWVSFKSIFSIFKNKNTSGKLVVFLALVAF